MKKNKQTSAVAFAEGYGLGIKFTTVIACPILSGTLCGIWLDRTLYTSPWLLLILLACSFAFSIYAVYRIASRLHKELN